MQSLANTPVTALVALIYVTLAFLTQQFEPGKLIEYGALLSPRVADGEPWRLLSYAFLHGGVLHLAMNSLTLLSLGPALEMSLGSLRFALLYVVSALGGGILVCLLYEPQGCFVIGGSGALFGFLGAIFALGMRAGRHAMQAFEEEHGKRAAGMLAFYVLAGFAFENISNTGHIGGLIAGFALTYWFLTPLRVAADRGVQLLRVGLVALFAAWLCYVSFPVARWDYLAAAWERSERPERRAALATAAGRAYGRPLADQELRMLLALLRPQ